MGFMLRIPILESLHHFSCLDNLKKLHLEPLSSVSSPAKPVASSAPNLIAIFPIKRRIRTTRHSFFSFLHFFRNFTQNMKVKTLSRGLN